MGFFNKLEKLSEKYIEGFFKSKFAGHIQPAEIAKILWREMRDNRNVSVSKVYVPNHYTVFLGNEDWKTIDSVRVSLSKELPEFLQKKARDKGYQVVGEIRVSFVLDEKLSLGTITVETAFVEEGDPQEKETQQKNSTIIAEKTNFYGAGQQDLNQDTLNHLKNSVNTVIAYLVLKTPIGEGHKFPLGTRGMILGRKRTNDIYIDDANVSRAHASIDYSDGEHYITDLGSTNGTYVNGARVNRARLGPGTIIKVGTTLLEYRVV